MRTHLLIALAMAAAAAAIADDGTNSPPKVIGAADAAKHFQETVVVTGRVAQVSIREKLVYLNLDKKFPDSPLTCVIFAGKTNQFGDLSKLSGQQVEVRGRIEDHMNRLQIILNSTNQLKVVEAKKAQ